MGVPHHSAASGEPVNFSALLILSETPKTLFFFSLCCYCWNNTNHPSFLCEKSDVGTQQERDSRTARALNMSLQYSFVTPLTSMVVTKPEASDSPLIADKLTEGKGVKG